MKAATNRKKKTIKRILSVMMVLTMLIGILPMSAWAVDHTHDASCGYSEPAVCQHAHDDSCGYAAEVMGVACGHNHDATCGYSEGTSGTPCGHTHDGACGFVQAVSGAPCTHTHDAACGYNEGSACNYEAAPIAETPVCTCETDDPAIHSTLCPLYTTPENPECCCAEKCTEANVWCDVCGFDVTACAGNPEEAPKTNATTENYIITLTEDDLANGVASGEGWSFDGNQLYINSGYELYFDGTCDWGVINEGTIEGGIFDHSVINESTIEGGNFSGGIANNGTISGGNFSSEITNNGTIKNGNFRGDIINNGTIEGGIFDHSVINESTIEDGTFNGSVTNFFPDGIISGGTFYGFVDNYGASITGGVFYGEVETGYYTGVTVTGGTFAGTITDYSNGNTTSGITIELSNALIQGGESYGWSLSGNDLTLNSGITFYWKEGEECAYHVTNNGTISGGTFSRDITNNGTIEGGTFGEVSNSRNGTITGGAFAELGNAGGLVTGTVDLSDTTWFVDVDGRYSKDVILPKAEIWGNIIYIGTAPDQLQLIYYADGVRIERLLLVSGNSYTFETDKYVRNDPDAEESTLKEIDHNVEVCGIPAYDIAVTKVAWDQFDITMTYSTELTITGITEGNSYPIGTDLSFTAIGGGMDNTSPDEDDWQFRPFYWKVVDSSGAVVASGDWVEENTIPIMESYNASIDTKAMEEGQYTLIVGCAPWQYQQGMWAVMWPINVDNWNAYSTVSVSFSLSHNFGTAWESDGTSHYHECTDSGCTARKDEAAHSGGTATCTEKARCSVCEAEYGELAAHTYGTEWESDGVSHWYECSCGEKADEAAHSGGTATCKDKAVCSACGVSYGELAAHNYKNGKCTFCKAADPSFVPETDTPQTGDSSHMALWLALLIISGCAVVILALIAIKKRKGNH